MTGWTVLAGCGKTTLARENFEGRTYGTTAERSRRMLKKAVQQGRRRVETGGVPSGYVEDFDEPRTTLVDFFSILRESD